MTVRNQTFFTWFADIAAALRLLFLLLISVLAAASTAGAGQDIDAAFLAQKPGRDRIAGSYGYRLNPLGRMSTGDGDKRRCEYQWFHGWKFTSSEPMRQAFSALPWP